MAHGAWCRVHGARCMVHGALCMVHGALCMVFGARFIVHGAWCTGQGARCIVHGVWCMVHIAGCTVQGAWDQVQGQDARCTVQAARCRVHGAGRRVHGAWCRGGGCMGVWVHGACWTVVGRERAGGRDRKVSSAAGEEKPMNDWHCKHEADIEGRTIALLYLMVVLWFTCIGRYS